jgi:hypothetical protein
VLQTDRNNDGKGEDRKKAGVMKNTPQRRDMLLLLECFDTGPVTKKTK